MCVGVSQANWVPRLINLDSYTWSWDVCVTSKNSREMYSKWENLKCVHWEWVVWFCTWKSATPLHVGFVLSTLTENLGFLPLLASPISTPPLDGRRVELLLFPKNPWMLCPNTSVHLWHFAPPWYQHGSQGSRQWLATLAIGKYSLGTSSVPEAKYKAWFVGQKRG